ncbi:hypothetical protein GCM10017083_18030 [Thalassobaculum fulvum]|uniref:Parvulin-like PPIase n=1 Tax=Thalassobaculum fulvum TaxID=1633335 RepID=A0A919CQB5_9PROT|nr:peptidyl-prolyl cis-trans isomerase [Thalassobaculum fulvum]GHD47545.1 hypothetical protein GCM10017083_18030 [Thalassobaculum fulvum]
MLQIIRSKVTSIFVKILFVLLIVSFAIWGIGDVFFGSPAGKVAVKIGDEVQYTTQDVATKFETERRRLGVPLTAEQAIQLGMLDQVIQGMVTEGIMIAATRSLDLSVSTDRVVEFVRSRFVDRSGNFDRARYQTFLANNGWSEAEFVQRLHEDFTRRQLIDALAAVGPAPKPVVDRVFAYREEQRVAQVVAIPAAAVPEPEDPAADRLQSFYDANTSRYEKPEYRSVSWAQIDPAALAKDIDVPEDEIRSAYDERAGQFATPERRDVQQILFETEDAAKAALTRIDGGEDFVAVAKDTTGVDEAGLDLGRLTRDALPDGTADTVFALQQDAVSEPVQSPFGWHLFRVLAIQPGRTTPYEEAKGKLRDELAHDRALDRVYETANRLEDALAGGATLEEAAKSLGLTVRSIEGLARSGDLKAGGRAETQPGGQFLELAFDTPQGQQSGLGEGDSGAFFVLRVDAVEAPRTPPLDEIRDQVVADWKTDRRLELAEQQADALAEKVKAGGDLKELAAAEQMPTAEVPAMTRSGRDVPESYPATLPATLFAIKEPGGVAVTSDDTQAVVVRLQRIIPADPSAKPEIRDSIASQIGQGVESDVIELLLADLRERFGVEVDQASVARLFESGQ